MVEDDFENDVPRFVRPTLSPTILHELDVEVGTLIRELRPNVIDKDVAVLLRLLDYERQQH